MVVATVQLKLIMLKAMEDDGTIIAGTSISTSITILCTVGPCSLLALGIIPGGFKQKSVPSIASLSNTVATCCPSLLVDNLTSSYSVFTGPCSSRECMT